ncbi:hypothetical protein M378DRAFT_297728 [Amanita muscaria Koide BX008]|uniref:Uncharacterized protein n=1 Tax=Amanita muscaria (strain Koide BX008) TaxID=946122 RepID=A0A0C2XEH2_AMAMK|nr:hypothetical protein M378DRAFT_297728 [Amanita muscaria Koide BX008]
MIAGKPEDAITVLERYPADQLNFVQRGRPCFRRMGHPLRAMSNIATWCVALVQRGLMTMKRRIPMHGVVRLGTLAHSHTHTRCKR